MKTRVVIVEGQKVILYFNETENKWHSEKEKAEDYFELCVMKADNKKARVIKRYYCESKIPYTRDKIRKMINESKGDLNQLYDTIINLKLEQ